MSESLDKFRRDLSELILSFLWQQWSCIGVMAVGSAERARVIDPEPLLLLTLEIARHDPRMFDEVVDWLIVNGKWINVVRLSTLFVADQVCSPNILGAVAEVLSQHDKTPKWKNLAKRLKPGKSIEAESLFIKNGQPLFLPNAEPDNLFLSYGFLRLPLQTRGLSSPVIPSPVPSWTSANFMFKARALFGVNIRADVFTYLVLQGVANPTRIARELGYSQRRVQDALVDMAAADIFKVRTTSKSKEYFVDSANTLRFLGVTENDISWFDWRALARALITVWRRVFAMRSEGLTPYILESEQAKVLREVKNDLLGAGHTRQVTVRTETSAIHDSRGLVQNIQSTLAPGDRYNWKRFWKPVGGTMSYSDGGYPYVPNAETDWVIPIKSEVFTFEKIAPVPCLVLLGEPGMGKSNEVKKAFQEMQKNLPETGSKALFIDLKDCGSLDGLDRELFESATFRGWAQGAYQLHIFLDSLDEAILHHSTIANFVRKKLKELPSVKGLFVRIACRPAEWPKSLEEGLQAKWGESAFKICELVPLTKPDVREACHAHSVDPDAFLRAVDQGEVVPLAFKPVTLEFLLKSFQKEDCLASSQKDLYAQGCRILCEEASPSRHEAKLAGKLTAEQRFNMAAHIAAATIFCNRKAIWVGPNLGRVPESDLILDELCSGTSGANHLEINRDTLLETLTITGLFSQGGPDRRCWSHQTYAEFLAAWFLIRQKTSYRQRLSLLYHSATAERKLVPQLHETAAWLASMDPAIFREIVNTDPEVLLRSDVATTSVGDREKLVASLLEQFNQDILINREWSFNDRYRKLGHPRLADQLRPFILDRSKNPIARREAINIAEACELKNLAADLALVALDNHDDYHVRIAAASFAVQFGEPGLKVRLKPLTVLPEEQDPNDRLQRRKY